VNNETTFSSLHILKLILQPAICSIYTFLVKDKENTRNISTHECLQLQSRYAANQCCGVGAGVVRSRTFLEEVGFLTTLGVGVGFFVRLRLRMSNWIIFTSHSKIRSYSWNGTISLETFVETMISTAKLHSLYVKKLETEILESWKSESDILPPTPQPCRQHIP